MSKLFPMYRQPRGGRKFLVKNVDMRCSFDGLREIAERKVGADFPAGDICYFENALGNRRKVLLERNGTVFQLYWMKVKGKFVEIDEAEGQIRTYIDFME